ncbi:ABC transmembrane type-1 domain-containing protein [Pseudoscourfieldia marina]
MAMATPLTRATTSPRRRNSFHNVVPPSVAFAVWLVTVSLVVTGWGQLAVADLHTSTPTSTLSPTTTSTTTTTMLCSPLCGSTLAEVEKYCESAPVQTDKDLCYQAGCCQWDEGESKCFAEKPCGGEFEQAATSTPTSTLSPTTTSTTTTTMPSPPPRSKKPFSLRVARRVSHAGDAVSLDWRAPACGNGHLTYEFRVELVQDGKTSVQAVEHLNKKTKQVEPTSFKCNQRASHTLTGLTTFAAYNATVVETTSGAFVASKSILFTPLVTPIGTPRNDGGDVLTAVTTGDAVARSDLSFGAVVFDLEGDGDDDILVLNEGENELLRNDGGGVLTAVTTGDAVARSDASYGSHGAVVFDLEGDGDDDILVVNPNAKNELLRNDGGGVLTAVTTGDAVARSDISLGAVVFDLEGDGDDDILVLNEGAKNELLRNDGGGVLTAVTTGDAVNRTDNSKGAVVFDLEGDGDDDILVVNTISQRILLGQSPDNNNELDVKKNELLRNDGGGVLTAVTTGDAVLRFDDSNGAVVFDLEGDGDDDILVLNEGAKNELLRNDGGGVLTAVTTSDAVWRFDNSYGAVAFDMEGDGDDDILVVNFGAKNELLRNDGGGVLTAVKTGDAVARADRSHGAVVFDLEGDGDDDILVLYSDTNELLHNDGGGVLTAVTTSDAVARSDARYGALVFDLEGDGDDDILVINDEGRNELLRNDGGGVLTAVTTGDAVNRTDNSKGAVVFDLEGDGDDDILVVNLDAKNELLRNDGGGVLTAVTTGDAVNRTDRSYDAVVFDLEGDGDDDILVINFKGKNELLRNDGGGVLTAVTTGDAVLRFDDSNGAVVFDLEGDGDDDILVLNDGEKNELLRNDGGGVLTPMTTGAAVARADRSFGAVVFDLEGDGDDDILVLNVYAKNELLRNDGGGVLTAVTTGDEPLGDPCLTSGVAVVAPEGATCLATWSVPERGAECENQIGCTNCDGFALGGWCKANLGGFCFCEKVMVNSLGAVVFDLEGDGDDDILVLNDGEKNELLRNDGGGVLTPMTTGDAVARTDRSFGAVVFDLEGDGDDDILVVNFEGNNLLVNCGSYMTSTPTGAGCVPSVRPTITSITPVTTSTTGSTVHLVSGKGFVDMTSLNITLGGEACTPSQLVDGTIALCSSAPAGTGASKPIVVTSYGVASDPMNRFSYLPPAITGIEPAFIDVSANSPTTTFTITGSDFGGVRSKRRLMLGPFDCVEPNDTDTVSHISLNCTVSDPAFATARGVFPAILTVDGQNSSDARQACYVASASSTTCLCEPGKKYDPVDNECVPCPPGQYNRDGLECIACPEHAICPGGSLLLPAAGWWRENATSLEFWRCARGECLADNATNPSPTGVVCRERHTGVLCGECVEGGARQGGPGCELCAATDSGGGALVMIGLLIGVLCLALALVWATWRHRFRRVEKLLSLSVNRNSSRSKDAEKDEKPEEDARHLGIDDAADRSKTKWKRAGLFLKVAITFYQCLVSYESTFDVPWPDAFRSFMGVLSTLSVQLLTMPGVGCVFRDVSSLNGLLFTVLWPLAPIGFVAISWFIGTRGGIASDDDRRTFSARCSDLLLRILFLIYPMQAAAMLGTFSCVPAAGREYLASNVTVVCWRGGEHAEMILLSTLGIVLYVVGIPAYFAWTLWRLDVPRLAREKREDAALLVAVEKFYASLDPSTHDEKVAELRACTASDVRQVLTESGLVPAVLNHVEAVAATGVEAAKRSSKGGGHQLAKLTQVSVATFEVGEVSWSECNLAAADAEGRAVAQGGFIFASYHSSAWFFELVDLARKLVLTGLLVFVDPGGISQLVVGLLVCLSMLLYSQHLRPFVDNAVDQANFHANVLLFVVLFAGLLLQNNAETQGDADEAVYTATLIFLSSSVAALPFLEVGRAFFERALLGRPSTEIGGVDEYMKDNPIAAAETMPAGMTLEESSSVDIVDIVDSVDNAQMR